jgi:aminoglycoside/choline kinase family phosphotransferase
MTVASSSDNFPATARFDVDTLASILQTIYPATKWNMICSAVTGDASDRQYFRLELQDAVRSDKKQSLIIMQLAGPVEEEETDFTRILKFLRQLNLPVPDLLHFDGDKGLLFLEDCGDSTLEDEINRRPGDKSALYRQAVELVWKMHQRATENIQPNIPAHALRFDVEKLMWEFDFMLEHYVGGLHGSPLTLADRQRVHQHFIPLCEALAAEPLVFTHRDYHCRNLMYVENGLVLLDFQDARMGPCQYDLASLLRDSYVDIDSGLRLELINHYIDLHDSQAQIKGTSKNSALLRASPDLLEGSGESKRKQISMTRSPLEIDRQKFLQIFDWMSIQRNLKAIGTFAFQSVTKQNDRYLEYVPRTLAYVRDTLSNRPELEALAKVLNQYIPNLGHL